MYQCIVDAFAELKAKGQSPNFLFFGGTQANIVALNAFIEKQHGEGIEMCGVVCNMRLPGRRARYDFDFVKKMLLLDEDSIAYIEAGIDFDYEISTWTRLKDMLHLLRLVFCPSSSRKSITKFAYLIGLAVEEPTEPIWATMLSIAKEITYVRYEEGIGSYMMTEKDWEKFSIAVQKTSARRFFRRLQLKVLAVPRLAIRRRLLNKVVARDDFLMLEPTPSGVVQEDEQNIEVYRRSYEKMGGLLSGEKFDFSGKFLLVGTNAFEDHGLTEMETALYLRIIEMLNQLGFDAIMATHPRQKQLEFFRSRNIPLIDSPDVPLEVTLARAVSKPVATIGLLSSAQVFANAFWGIPGISLEALFCDEITRSGMFDEELRFRFDEMARARSVFANFISTPTSWNELELSLARIKAAH